MKDAGPACHDLALAVRSQDLKVCHGFRAYFGDPYSKNDSILGSLHLGKLPVGDLGFVVQHGPTY